MDPDSSSDYYGNNVINDDDITYPAGSGENT